MGSKIECQVGNKSKDRSMHKAWMVEVQGNSQGTFFAQIMNEMVLKLRQNVTGPE